MEPAAEGVDSGAQPGALDALGGARALRWRVKDTFRSYVQRSGGNVRLVQPIEVVGESFRFPRAPAEGIRFTGGVLFSAHAGFLKVLVAEPSLRPTAAGLGLFVAHPSAPESIDDQWRLADAEIESVTAGAVTLTVRLTAEGAGYFGGAYAEGTQLDPIELEL